MDMTHSQTWSHTPSVAVVIAASGERLSGFVLSGTRSYAVPEEITALSVWVGKQAVVITLRCAASSAFMMA